MLTNMKNLDKDIIIFSDIDGSFMNHNDYSFEELKPFVDKNFCNLANWFALKFFLNNLFE